MMGLFPPQPHLNTSSAMTWQSPSPQVAPFLTKVTLDSCPGIDTLLPWPSGSADARCPLAYKGDGFVNRFVLLSQAIMLVTAAVARSSSSSHKEGKRHHHPQQPKSHKATAAVDLVRQLDRSWNNITTFPMMDAEEMTPSQPERSVGGSKRKKSGGGKSKQQQDWGKKHKRKLASLLSLAEQDRKLSLTHLPRLPAATSTSARFAAEKSHSTGLECCPTVVEMVQPSGGTNMEGHVVELYRHGDLDQRIYEHSCRPDVLNQPCRFVEKLLRPLSRCVQQFSFTYAVVSDHPAGEEWRLDYIRIRNGCSCEIQPP